MRYVMQYQVGNVSLQINDNSTSNLGFEIPNL